MQWVFQMSNHKLYVKIHDEFHELSAIAVGPNLKSVKKISISESIEKYLNLCTSQKCIKNQKVEASFFNKFLTYFEAIGIDEISDIHFIHLTEFQNHLCKTMKSSSVNRRFFTIKHFFNMLEKWDLIAVNPCKEVKQKRIEENRYKTWTDHEFLLFLNECSGVHKHLFQFLWLTGARPMEAKNLTWNDINYDKRELLLKCAKNAKIARAFPITDKVSSLLHSIDMNGLNVFGNITNDQLYQYAKHRLKKLNLDHLTVYGLRHSFASRLSSKKVNVFLIQQLMGHSDLRTTKGYVKIEKNELIEALKFSSF